MTTTKQNRRWHWIFWIGFAILNHIIWAEEKFSLGSTCITLIYILHNAGTAYVILDYLIPRLYHQKRYFYFLIGVFATILMFSTLLVLSLLASFGLLSIPVDMINISTLIGSSIGSNFTGLTGFVIPYFVVQKIDSDRRNRELEKEKLRAELNNLKAQLHPHFLFNALNNIYFLIKKDPDAAAQALVGFSDLLRFQLYESNDNFIPLADEIDFLKKYTDISKLSKGENFNVIWELPEIVDNIQVPSLLIMPLLENAFKHSVNNKGQIKISLTMDKSDLYVSIKNTKEEQKLNEVTSLPTGGLGLANIKERMNLLYPESEVVTIEDNQNSYEIILRLRTVKGNKND